VILRHPLLNVCLLQEHLVLGPCEPLEPRCGREEDDEDAKDDNQKANPVDEDALG
jgi:hypothetical protein